MAFALAVPGFCAYVCEAWDQYSVLNVHFRVDATCYEGYRFRMKNLLFLALFPVLGLPHAHMPDSKCAIQILKQKGDQALVSYHVVSESSKKPDSVTVQVKQQKTVSMDDLDGYFFEINSGKTVQWHSGAVWPPEPLAYGFISYCPLAGGTLSVVSRYNPLLRFATSVVNRNAKLNIELPNHLPPDILNAMLAFGEEIRVQHPYTSMAVTEELSYTFESHEALVQRKQLKRNQYDQVTQHPSVASLIKALTLKPAEEVIVDVWKKKSGGSVEYYEVELTTEFRRYPTEKLLTVTIKIDGIKN